MLKPDPNKFAVETLILGLHNLPSLLRGQLGFLRAQFDAVKANPAQVEILGADRATVEGILASVESVAAATEAALGEN